LFHEYLEAAGHELEENGALFRSASNALDHQADITKVQE